jgi:hypothetical protein
MHVDECADVVDLATDTRVVVGPVGIGRAGRRVHERPPNSILSAKPLFQHKTEAAGA